MGVGTEGWGITGDHRLLLSSCTDGRLRGKLHLRARQMPIVCFELKARRRKRRAFAFSGGISVLPLIINCL